MNKKGFTLIELIAVITLFSIISLLVFGALTGSIKSASVKEMEVYKDNVSRAAQVYVETNLENYTLNNPGEYLVLKGAKIIEAGYLDKSIKNPSSCPIEEVNIRIYMESDYTLSYTVYCDGEEPTLPDGSEPAEPETPETPSQTLYVFEYTGAVQNVTLPAGKWKLEVWGAQGGYTTESSQTLCRGGYSSGVLNITSETQIYIYVGEKGTYHKYTTEVYPATFNGGGSTFGNNNTSTGGGATDIRIGQDSLYARVIVAGGGGGASLDNSSYKGGEGGGLYGIDGSSANNSNIGTGGTIYDGYLFGVGQDASGANNGFSGAGGGGWYGGTSGYPGNGEGSAAGGGGSGWIYTADNFNTWQAGNPTDAAGWLLNSSYYLTNASTIAGNESFIDPDGTEVTGHTGNGYARITWVSN